MHCVRKAHPCCLTLLKMPPESQKSIDSSASDGLLDAAQDFLVSTLNPSWILVPAFFLKMELLIRSSV
jgi:hypothetical protein